MMFEREDPLNFHLQRSWETLKGRSKRLWNLQKRVTLEVLLKPSTGKGMNTSAIYERMFWLVIMELT